MRRETIAWSLVALLSVSAGTLAYVHHIRPALDPTERAARQVHQKFGRDAYLAYTVEATRPDSRCGMIYMVEQPRSASDYIVYATPTMFVSRPDGLTLIGDPRAMPDNPRMPEFKTILEKECPKLTLPPLWGPAID